MSCIVKCYDKKTGTTYCYASESYWDPIKKQPTAHRRCIGKLGPNGEIIPTGKRGRPRKENADINPASTPPDKTEELQTQLSKVLASKEDCEFRLRNLEAKVADLGLENRQLRHKLSNLTEAFKPLKDAFQEELQV